MDRRWSPKHWYLSELSCDCYTNVPISTHLPIHCAAEVIYRKWIIGLVELPTYTTYTVLHMYVMYSSNITHTFNVSYSSYYIIYMHSIRSLWIWPEMNLITTKYQNKTVCKGVRRWLPEWNESWFFWKHAYGIDRVTTVVKRPHKNVVKISAL